MERAELQALLAPLKESLEDLAGAITDEVAIQAQRAAETRRELERRAEEGRQAERRRTLRDIAFAVALVLLTAGMGVILYSALTSRTILNRVESVTSPDARAAQGESTKRLLVSLSEEIDCRSRRMQMRLPAPPDASLPCRAQTEPGVYPGEVGQPPPR